MAAICQCLQRICIKEGCQHRLCDPKHVPYPVFCSMVDQYMIQHSNHEIHLALRICCKRSVGLVVIDPHKLMEASKSGDNTIPVLKDYERPGIQKSLIRMVPDRINSVSLHLFRWV